jgi:hypothetical protein
MTLLELAKNANLIEVFSVAEWTRVYKAYCLGEKSWSKLGLGGTYATVVPCLHRRKKPESRDRVMFSLRSKIRLSWY